MPPTHFFLKALVDVCSAVPVARRTGHTYDENLRTRLGKWTPFVVECTRLQLGRLHVQNEVRDAILHPRNNIKVAELKLQHIISLRESVLSAYRQQSIIIIHVRRIIETLHSSICGSVADPMSYAHLKGQIITTYPSNKTIAPHFYFIFLATPVFLGA